MTGIEDEARAESDRRYPESAPLHPQVRWFLNDKRAAFQEGYVAGHHRAASRQREGAPSVEDVAQVVVDTMQERRDALVRGDDLTKRAAQDIAERVVALYAPARPREVTTVAELDALPTGSVVLSEQRAVWEREADGHWIETGQTWRVRPEDIALPARVLYAPAPDTTTKETP